MSDKEKWYNNNWVSGSGLVIITLMVSGVGYKEIIKKQTITPALSDAFTWVYHTLGSFLNYDVKVWWILSSVIAGFVIYIILQLNVGNKSSPTLDGFNNFYELPDWLNYKKDKLKKWMWVWDYNYNSISRQYDIVNMRPYCESCKIAMIQDYGYAYCSCPKCDKEYPEPSDYWESEHPIKCLILDKIEKGTYQKKTPKTKKALPPHTS